MTKFNPFLWLSVLLAILLLYFGVSSGRSSAREGTLKAAMARMEMRIAADQAFIASDTTEAFRLYRLMGDTALLAERMQALSLQPAGETSFRARQIAQIGKSAANLDAAERAAYLRQIDSLDILLEEVRAVLKKSSGPVAPAPLAASASDPAISGGKEFLQFFSNKKGGEVYYLGEVVKGKANGRGVAVWKNGGLYQGEWKDNLRQGTGVYKWPDGEKYEGDYHNDKRHGYGVYTTKNGEQYQGLWIDDMRHGEGRLFDKKGRLKLHGIWEADRLTRELKN